uniref:NADH dehydrogenase subunit 6 n=1 Tax=Urechis caupo TaxID=6431 RepID=Q5YA30_URECA|nr:NADH dehydrogenase subunit 6 [Urechis caupo]AAT12189.1 NADH dehydrogenase subunit 6 [Urechis caupo]
MSLSFTLILSMSLICSLFLATSPLTLGIWVLILALMIATTMALALSSWFGMITFLIYVGGMMVMFSYFAALSPNQQLNLGPMAKTTLATLLLLMTTLKFFAPPSLSPFSSTPKLTFMYQPENLSLLIFFGSILFFALVAVVKISRRESGPLRPFK